MNEDALNVHLLDAVISRKYPQNPLLNPDEFVTFLDGRVGPVWKNNLEELDQEGLFCPLLKVSHASSFHRILNRSEDGQVRQWDETPLSSYEVNDDIIQVFQMEPSSLQEWQEARDEGRILFRTANNFEPWEGLQSEGTRTATFFYHPFQVFQFLHATAAINAGINLLHHPFTPEEAWKVFDRFQKQLDLRRNEIQSDIVWKKHLLLLLLIEDKYLPPIREVVSYHEFSFREGYDWEEWAAAFDVKRALEASQMSIDEVVKFHHDMARIAKANDVIFSWFSVIRHMPYDQRKNAKGKIRLTWDRYEITEMLGDFLADLTGERQQLPDDVVSGGSWKTQAFGIPLDRIDYKLGNALPGILRNYGIDPRSRVWVFVEGETEEQFIKEWFTGNEIELSLSRVQLVNLRSFSGLSNPSIRDQAQQARSQEAAIYVLVDEDENRAKRVSDLQEWIKKGYISRIFSEADMDHPNALPIGGFVWEPCFEDHNFTLEELLAAWRWMLEEEYGEGSINESGFGEAVAEVRNGGYGTHIKAIEEIAKRQRRSLLITKHAKQAQFSKAKMGRALAVLCRGSEKPITRILQLIVYIADLRSAVYRPTSEA